MSISKIGELSFYQKETFAHINSNSKSRNTNKEKENER